MNYEGQICRGPMERSAFMLPVMVGCSYNRCKFCGLFRHLRYRVLPMEQVEAELKRVKELNGSPKRIFLGDGNAFDLPTEHLLEILRRVEAYFPDREMVNMDATVTGILRKSDGELRELAAHGVRHLYLGIESGLDDVLTFMRKDHGLAQARAAIRRLQEAGMLYDAHIMTGVAGADRGTENAEALAEFLNETHPAHVINFSMFLHKEGPLYADVQSGAFLPADELENLREERRLLELLTAEIKYDGFHDYVQVRVRGDLPRDREKMLAKLDKAMAEQERRAPVYAFTCGTCPDLVKCDGEIPVWTTE